MSEAKESQEPTMEEILASIRRIISEDGEPEGDSEDIAAEAPEASEVAEPAPVEPSVGDNVLELTEVVEETEPVAGEAEPEPVAEDDEIAFDDEGDLAPELKPEPVPVPEFVPRDDAGLVSPATAKSTATAFTDVTSAAAATRGMALGQNQTLEAIVKELLRPMLKDWLDENLTALVQRIVEREVVKLAGRAEDDKWHN